MTYLTVSILSILFSYLVLKYGYFKQINYKLNIRSALYVHLPTTPDTLTASQTQKIKAKAKAEVVFYLTSCAHNNTYEIQRRGSVAPAGAMLELDFYLYPPAYAMGTKVIVVLNNQAVTYRITYFRT